MTLHKISMLASSIDNFPPLPTVAGRVMEITADPESSIQDLMKVINADQSLVVMILKMANSPFFGISRRVDSLKQALLILGFKEIRNMVLGKAVFNSFKHVGNGNKFEARQFWRHSFVCGLGARIIGAELRLTGLDFFVAGLIHDVGKLVMHTASPTEFSKVIEMAEPVEKMAFEVEKEIFGVAHDEVGMMLLKRWMFPEALISTVGYHHRPREAKEGTLFSLVLHVADILAHIDELSGNSQTECSSYGEYFGPEVVDLFQEHGVDWDEAVSRQFMQALAEQKEKESDLLTLFLPSA